MGGKSIVISILTAWLAQGVAARGARGDGGVVRFSERRSDRVITVFTAPTPLRVGPADVSVLVQNADSGTQTSGASIEVRAYPVLHRQNGTSAQATTEAATNKLLQAAQLTFSESGRWHVDVSVSGPSAEPPTGFDVDVVEPPPAWLDLSAWMFWPLLPIGLFAVHQMLDRRRRNSLTPRSAFAPGPRSAP